MSSTFEQEAQNYNILQWEPGLKMRSTPKNRIVSASKRNVGINKWEEETTNNNMERAQHLKQKY